MKLRHLQGLGLLLVVALVSAGGPALAGAPRAPLTSVNWTLGADLPFGATRFDGALDSATHRVYFLGFRAADNSTDGEVWYYDVASKTYTDTGVFMPVPVSNYSIAALNDPNGLGFYIFGGRDNNGGIITNVQVYYPATNSAQDVSTDPWPGTTPSACVSLPAMGVAVVSNKAYVLGGASFSTSVPPCVDDQTTQTWRFNPMAPAGSRWKRQAPLNVARGYITTAVLGSKIYAIGGDVNSAGTLIPQATVESWTPGDRHWDDAGVADLTEPCDESQAFAFTAGRLANTITLAGCGQWPSALADVLQYDVLGNSWSVIGALNVARRNHAGANIGSTSRPALYIVGGYDSTGGVTLMSSEIGKPGASGAQSGGASSGSSGNVPTN